MTELAANQPIQPDPIPLLPGGELLFDAIPLRAVLMEPLAPALVSGTMVVRDGDRGAAVLVRSGALVEAHAFEGGGSRSGDGVAAEVQGWQEATITATRLEPVLVDVCEALLRGDVIYSDLRLEWVDWAALLADFGRRGGAFAVEMTTSAGRGVTCVSMGQQTISYTDIHPALGDPELLEAMAATKDGSIRVRRLDATAFAATLGSGLQDRPVTVLPDRHADTGGGARGAGEMPRPAPASRAALPDLAWVAPWQAWGASQPDAGALEGASGAHAPAVSEVIDELRAIAQRRLQLSSMRVEAVLDEAAREERSLGSVLDEIRAMSIRGVMPATLDSMVEEMAAASMAHRPG